jgi:regulator of RNase E activity RraA
VLDGGVRDLHQIDALDFPVFARYRTPLDIRGRGEMVGFGEPVDYRGLTISPGDLIFADANGVVALPAASALAVLLRCEDRIVNEAATEAELREGASAVDVYSRHEAF